MDDIYNHEQIGMWKLTRIPDFDKKIWSSREDLEVMLTSDHSISSRVNTFVVRVDDTDLERGANMNTSSTAMLLPPRCWCELHRVKRMMHLEIQLALIYRQHNMELANHDDEMRKSELLIPMIGSQMKVVDKMLNVAKKFLGLQKIMERKETGVLIITRSGDEPDIDVDNLENELEQNSDEENVHEQQWLGNALAGEYQSDGINDMLRSIDELNSASTAVSSNAGVTNTSALSRQDHSSNALEEMAALSPFTDGTLPFTGVDVIEDLLHLPAIELSHVDTSDFDDFTPISSGNNVDAIPTDIGSSFMTRISLPIVYRRLKRLRKYRFSKVETVEEQEKESLFTSRVNSERMARIAEMIHERSVLQLEFYRIGLKFANMLAQSFQDMSVYARGSKKFVFGGYNSYQSGDSSTSTGLIRKPAARLVEWWSRRVVDETMAWMKETLKMQAICCDDDNMAIS